VTNNDCDSSPEMTSRGGSSDERRAPTSRTSDEQGATAATAGELGQDKEAVTDRVIHQLLDQIAQLQRASD